MTVCAIAAARPVPARRGRSRLIVVPFLLLIVLRSLIGLIRLSVDDGSADTVHFDALGIGVSGPLAAVAAPAVLVLEFGARRPAAGVLLGGRNCLRQRDFHVG